MSEFENEVDYFSDADLAETENLPDGSKCLGIITAVDCSQAEGQDSWATWKDNSKHPTIVVTVQAKCYENGEPFDYDKNFMRQSKVNYAVGKGDFGGPQLAKLAKGLLVQDEAELKMKKKTEVAKELVNGKVKFTVKWTKMKEGDGSFMNFNNVKAASDAEVGLMA